MHTHSNRRFAKYGHLAVDLCIVLVALAHFGPLAGTLDGGSAAPSAAVASPRIETVNLARTCFPDSKWDEQYGVPDSKRPCARIVRVEEDGSVSVEVSDASGKVRFVGSIGAQDR